MSLFKRLVMTAELWLQARRLRSRDEDGLDHEERQLVDFWTEEIPKVTAQLREES